ncbi:M28 family metallopeptidase [Nitratireductor soli]|uniref:M28 family metallopeptidase n=1 Tax=Nitratireductor soli TaxID=1670619 RepID=UPI00065DCE00|nr:M28 family metallopeptidase [Nitratireductor soli]
MLDASRIWADLSAICDTGGRQTGTESELTATELLARLGEEATGVAPWREAFPYDGWAGCGASLTLGNGERLPANPLLRSVPTPAGGLEAEVIDLGRGTPEEFAAHRGEIAGRIALVRHELMFAAGTVHRRMKYNAAVEAGAVGFLIAGPLAGNLVAGSSGRGNEAGIPAAGVSPETAAILARTSAGYARIRLEVDGFDQPGSATNLIFDLKGQTQQQVVLSAHIDGHALGESALDNASGLAVALAVARELRPKMENRKRSLRLALFNAEEWALTGSDMHLQRQSAAERNATVLNVNLDTVAGGDRLTALTSGYKGIEPFLLSCSEAEGVPLGLFRPLQVNSDHGNFAQAGIPAFRLVDGFNNHMANTRHLLTTLDRRDLATPEELLRSARLTLEIVRRALDATDEETDVWRNAS